MNLQQLRYLVAVRDNGLSITAAARTLSTSQPAVSRQIQLLEQELGFPLFERSGRSLSRATTAGAQVISRADSVMREVQNIRRTSVEFGDNDDGTMTVATTHTQARYVLPDVVREFRAQYPKVRIHIHQGSSEQIADMIGKGHADFAVVTGSAELFPRIVRLPLYQWRLGLVVPRDHPLTRKRVVTLADLVKYPIVTYEFSLNSSSSLLAAFEREGLEPEVALTAQDADVVKEYVRVGLGVGLLAPFAVDPLNDPDLVVLETASLFTLHMSWIGFRAGGFLSTYMLDFVMALAPHLPVERVRRAQSEPVTWEDISLPLRGAVAAVPPRGSRASSTARKGRP